MIRNKVENTKLKMKTKNGPSVALWGTMLKLLSQL